MNIQQLESFIQVAENLSFARAAEYLNITQSAVSRQVHGLEEELDTRLFYRTTRTVSLTPEGIIFLEHAKRILEQLKIASAKIQHHTNARMQPLAIGCESEMDLDLLCKILQACRQQIMAFHPFLKVFPHRSLLNLFFQGEIEVLFGFRENLPDKEGMVFEELGKVPLCCVLPRTHPLAERETVREEELFSQQLILCTAYTIPAKAVEIQNRIAQHISPEKIHASENQDVILTLIRAGYGCSVLPRAAYLDTALAYVPLADTPLLSYGIVYREDSSNPVLKKFIDITLNVTGR